MNTPSTTPIWRNVISARVLWATLAAKTENPSVAAARKLGGGDAQPLGLGRGRRLDPGHHVGRLPECRRRLDDLDARLLVGGVGEPRRRPRAGLDGAVIAQLLQLKRRVRRHGDPRLALGDFLGYPDFHVVFHSRDWACGKQSAPARISHRASLMRIADAGPTTEVSPRAGHGNSLSQDRPTSRDRPRGSPDRRKVHSSGRTSRSSPSRPRTHIPPARRR